MRNVRQDILDFWFIESTPAQWFQKNPDFDTVIARRFEADFTLAVQGFYDGWMADAHGALALIILLDQFPRNMYRGDAKAFSGDEKALAHAREAVARHYDHLLKPEERIFMYLPFEHSESIEDQEKSLSLFESIREAQPVAYDYAVRHLEIIRRFGRFPHRNAVLGRESTPEETEFLKQDGSHF